MGRGCEKGVRAIPENLFAEELKPAVQSNYLIKITYHSRSQDVGIRLDEFLRLIERALFLAQEHGLDSLEEFKLLARLLDEQTEIVPILKDDTSKIISTQQALSSSFFAREKQNSHVFGVKILFENLYRLFRLI